MTTIEVNDGTAASPGAPSSVQTPAAPAAALPETPTQKIVREANQTQYATDDNGRRIGWRKLTTLEEFDFLEIVGGANANNAPWLLMATCAQAVVELDGEPVPRPTSRAQLRAMIQRLGEAGMKAIRDAIIVPDENSPEVERAKN